MMNLFWSFYNIICLAVASILCIELPRYRREERFLLNEDSFIEINGYNCEGILTDLSLLGASFKASSLRAKVNDPLKIHIAGVGFVNAEVIGLIEGGLRLNFRADSAIRAALVRKIFDGSIVPSISAMSFLEFTYLWLRRIFV